MKHIPYTYLITFVNPKTKEKKFYYGSQYGKGCSPDNLFKTYFTSSKSIKALIEEFGLDCFEYQIRKLFIDNPKGAMDWESKVLRRLNVSQSNKWINITNSGPIDVDLSKFVFLWKNDRRTRVLKSLVEDYISNGWSTTITEEYSSIMSSTRKGKRKPEGFGKKISLRTTGKPKSLEHKKNISEAVKKRNMSGERHPNYGKPASDKIRKAVAKANSTRIWTDEMRKKSSKIAKGKVWIHNPLTKVRKLVYPDQIHLYEDYKLGFAIK